MLVGKTHFLTYVFMERLREHKPVAFQPLGGHSYCALFTDAVAFHFLDGSMSLRHANHAGDVWALTDSNAMVTTPDTVFQRIGMRIIQTTPPYAYRWKEWSKQYGAERCVMNVWSQKEIEDLA
ncbi:hypothetical protein J3R83DRAFT_5457 [Lanmaoa asiatica]|nr:hypothetical protein J3R83DRAFT_5457 [Lanmaoa asiatica]